MESQSSAAEHALLLPLPQFDRARLRTERALAPGKSSGPSAATRKACADVSCVAWQLCCSESSVLLHKALTVLDAACHGRNRLTSL
ncbi:hypothetical protein MPTK1_2g03130 [Marchantia polymorpha subsp. ruderalis]|uniref:Uncharacterized protein n=1 Tax=Marchantia polymorpha TaxID=3197 RepID=A0A2R6WMB1_MARPO|nr:hypothetical protein MARPO_0075s0074 [Marchantia polymorpha]BBN00923.1 hypothetical protein Mp_2g03130 [Marchantia polymorpha subsp. ruderalis]|eukprot:PTQ34977.1 hypothetical protein MARPO_0075s0074 [Marchantia polymorpha]